MDNLFNVVGIPYGDEILHLTSESSINTINGQSIYHALFTSQKRQLSEVSYQYKVSWDLTAFYKQEMNQLVDWGIPHNVKHITSTNEAEKDTIKQELKLALESIAYVPEYYKVLSFGRHRLVIINFPIQSYNHTSDIIYGALGVDNNGNYFHLYWNILNLFSPFKIELVNDFSTWGNMDRPINNELKYI